MDEPEIAEDAPLSADEVLTFGPCVEAQVWTPMWIQESRAPIAVAAGKPKLGKVFDDRGIGKAVIIRPCMSRGRRLRGLPPIYTPQMLEKNTSVFDGWSMFLDHVPPELAQTMAKHGRSVRELGGQLLKGSWVRDFVQEGDADFGYRPGAVVADVWATPFIRGTVGNNPNLLHTSINAWPTSGKPGACPWRPSVKGMVIEGIRRQPQGSVDYVVRGGAGGKLLVAEGLEDEGAWPELGEWAEDDRRFVVSLAESLYASPRMTDLVLPTKPEELRSWLQEHADHLLPALEAADDNDSDDAAKVAKRNRQQGGNVVDDKGTKDSPALREEDVTAIVQRALSGMPSAEEFERNLQERFEERLTERETQRTLSEYACGLIERAENILPSWKADLKARYTLLPSGPTPMLLVEGEVKDDQGTVLSDQQVIEARVNADLDHVRSLIAEAQGKPRVTGHGGAKPDPHEGRQRRQAATPFWREEFVSMGLAESADKAGEVFGARVGD